ncbi:alpha-1,3-mannosyltransferase CMT1 [Kwoniella heveanensis CBS 569]|nr:alpha-1,3-mannosyltransferase CMT1 [Kwoniella heveanensis CBS 569]
MQRRSSSSSLFKAFKPSTPPLPQSHLPSYFPVQPPAGASAGDNDHEHGHAHSYHSSILSRPHLRFPLVVALITALLFLYSLLFSRPDPSIHHSFQFPGMFPSRPSQLHVNDPELGHLINSTYTSYLATCPGGVSPVYLDPALTASQQERYSILKRGRGRYMLVTNTRQIQDHLPDLLNSIIVLTKYLGKDKIALSMLEGPSGDCTPQTLKDVLIPLTETMGISSKYVRIATDEPKIDWNQHNRIEKISELRNRALQPLWEEWKDDIQAVVFFNDVYIHAGDVLELLFQHVKGGAAITTGMDWWKKRPEYYYDIWVGRTIDTGDLFYPIDWTWWSPSSDLFPNSPKSKDLYASLKPFQVFSTWNAMAVLDPKPFLPPFNIRFRRSDRSQDECAASECTLIASDFWKIGFGKVQVVPSVQFAYERDVALDIIEDLGKQKWQLGWIDGVPPKDEQSTKTDWINRPPPKVRCHPWPEVNGLSANVWEETKWVGPWAVYE